MGNENENGNEISKEEALRKLEENAEVQFDDIKENQEKRTSLGKVNLNREADYRASQEEEVRAKLGWHKINPEYFPSRGMFYDKLMVIKIKAADVPQIRHFSAIDESDPFSVNEALNDLLVTCCQVTIDGRMTSHKDILEEDRIYLILEIRALTFPNGENKLSFKTECQTCDELNEIEIANKNFQHRELPEEIMKYYSDEHRCFIIKTKSYGEFSIKPPSIGVMLIVTSYIKSLQEKGKRKLDSEFIKCLAYMIQDWKGFNVKDIEGLHMEYMRWDKNRFSLMIKLINWAKVSVDENMKVICSNHNCGAEVTARITFPGGIKDLFVVSDFTGELL